MLRKDKKTLQSKNEALAKERDQLLEQLKLLQQVKVACICVNVHNVQSYVWYQVLIESGGRGSM